MNIKRVPGPISWAFVGFAAIAFPALPGVGQAIQGTFDLFTSREAQQWNTVLPNGQPQFRPRDLSEDGKPNCHAIPSGAATGADPQIKILAPSLDKPLAAPLDIDVQFVAGPDPIQPDTFRVCYIGFLTMDITKRITDHVTVSAKGLHVSGAQLPQGHHHLVLLIADQQGRLGRHDAVFDIE